MKPYNPTVSKINWTMICTFSPIPCLLNCVGWFFSPNKLNLSYFISFFTTKRKQKLWEICYVGFTVCFKHQLLVLSRKVEVSGLKTLTQALTEGFWESGKGRCGQRVREVDGCLLGLDLNRQGPGDSVTCRYFVFISSSFPRPLSVSLSLNTSLGGFFNHYQKT